MAKKGGQVVLQEEINTNEDWAKMLEKPGIYSKLKYVNIYQLSLNCNLQPVILCLYQFLKILFSCRCLYRLVWSLCTNDSQLKKNKA